jgi:hypothetical protein
MPAETLRAYCLCGATAEATSVPDAAARAVIAEFRAWHTGADHGEATRQQAADARRRAERIAAEMQP